MPRELFDCLAVGGWLAGWLAVCLTVACLQGSLLFAYCLNELFRLCFWLIVRPWVSCGAAGCCLFVGSLLLLYVWRGCLAELLIACMSVCLCAVCFFSFAAGVSLCFFLPFSASNTATPATTMPRQQETEDESSFFCE